MMVLGGIVWAVRVIAHDTGPCAALPLSSRSRSLGLPAVRALHWRKRADGWCLCIAADARAARQGVGSDQGCRGNGFGAVLARGGDQHRSFAQGRGCRLFTDRESQHLAPCLVGNTRAPVAWLRLRCLLARIYGPSLEVWRFSHNTPPHSHNGFLDLLLAFGAVGLTVFAVAFAVTWRRGLAQLHVGEGSAGRFRLFSCRSSSSTTSRRAGSIATRSLEWILLSPSPVHWRRRGRTPRGVSRIRCRGAVVDVRGTR